MKWVHLPGGQKLPDFLKLCAGALYLHLPSGTASQAQAAPTMEFLRGLFGQPPHYAGSGPQIWGRSEVSSKVDMDLADCRLLWWDRSCSGMGGHALEALLFLAAVSLSPPQIKATMIFPRCLLNEAFLQAVLRHTVGNIR